MTVDFCQIQELTTIPAQKYVTTCSSVRVRLGRLDIWQLATVLFALQLERMHM